MVSFFFDFLLFLCRVADENCSILEVLEAIRPHLQLTFENVLAHINTIYVLQTRQGAMGKHERYLRLKVCMNNIISSLSNRCIVP